MAKIRVLRLLEYTFADQESAESHMNKFSVPAIGTYDRAPGVVIRSSIITNLNPDDARYDPVVLNIEGIRHG